MPRFGDFAWLWQKFSQVTGADNMLEIALERMNAVDGWGQTHFYDKDFAHKEFAQSAYSRFSHTGSILTCTEHSFSYLGFAGRWADDTATGPSFAEKSIHPEHMPYIYRPMIIYAQLVRAELNLFESRLDALPGAGDEVRRLHEEFVDFVHRTWRETISTQVQGQEVFALITRRFAIKERIDKLSADFAALDLKEAQQRRKQAAEHEKRSEQQMLVFSFMVGLFTAVFTVFQVMGDDRKIYFPIAFLTDWLTITPTGSDTLWNFAILIGLMVVVTALVFFVVTLVFGCAAAISRGWAKPPIAWVKSKCGNKQ